MLICHPVTSRPLIFRQKAAVFFSLQLCNQPFDSFHSELLSPFNFASHEMEDPFHKAPKMQTTIGFKQPGLGLPHLSSGVARGLLQGRPLQLPMGWGVGEELTKSWPTFEQLCVQNLAWAIFVLFFSYQERVQNPAG